MGFVANLADRNKPIISDFWGIVNRFINFALAGLTPTAFSYIIRYKHCGYRSQK
jgi:hypothetical protein